eukprot:snap_masked-scaffold_24-processed-gene-5.12-mRNA-1 protein AED:1.00 eAED:1.00 QI:0/0/0/0/1/1/2/0/75
MTKVTISTKNFLSFCKKIAGVVTVKSQDSRKSRLFELNRPKAAQNILLILRTENGTDTGIQTIILKAKIITQTLE